jgi:hypothetical protein
MFARFAFVGGLAVAMFVGTTAPASAATVAPTEWAPKFCSTIESFGQKLQSDGDAAEAALSGQVTNLKQAKAQLVSFLSKSVANAKHARQALQQAGTPNTLNGAKIAARFSSALHSAQVLFASAASTAGSLSTTSLPKFEATSKKITAALNKGGDAIEASFNDIATLDTDGAIRMAMRATPACAFLGTTPPTS